MRPSRKTNRPKKIDTFALTVSITTGSAKIAKTISQSIAPETRQNPGYRSTARLESQGDVLTLKIKAQDMVALRAASNSFLRFIAASQGAIMAVAPFYRTRRVSRPNST